MVVLRTVYFPHTPLFTEKISPRGTVHPGIFRGQALWGDGVSSQMNGIASRDQFKPIRIREDLVMNHNSAYSSPLNFLRFLLV